MATKQIGTPRPNPASNSQKSQEKAGTVPGGQALCNTFNGEADAWRYMK